VFKPMKEEAVERIVADLQDDTFVKESMQVIPDEVLSVLNDSSPEFLQGYLSGMSYTMNSTSRVHQAMAQQNIVEAMQIKQFGNTILYLVSKKLLDPDFDFVTLKKDIHPEPGRIIVPGK